MYRCQTCSARFYSKSGREEHMDDYSHWRCDWCDRTFRTERACDQHMITTGHMKKVFLYPCDTCNVVFRYEDDADEHMEDLDHWKYPYSCDTNLTFRHEQHAYEHMEEKGRHGNYCSDCDRHFVNENALKMYMRSRTHQGTTVSCPFCKVNHVTASGLSHYLETGSCAKAPRLNRDTILRIIRERDPNGLITNKQLTYHGGGGTTSTYEATDQAWNGSCWECYMCHRGFRTSHALNQHLKSSAHQQKEYHCPNRRCGKEFKALAGLFNHLESETCAFMRFENVQKQVEKVSGVNKLIAFG
ncbi:Uu.00g097540.m01.CDS01 [Anthostomella pinea]|uniref:Uu.00g097540.m01.CDS01 n=1 Tax=Anthostomella pinea TaxID=933095 RepID=A0AAI8VDE8_9PEZI|nr:Uu.00g097540.m01.CDS01 [Anthostomella pinea]